MAHKKKTAKKSTAKKKPASPATARLSDADALTAHGLAAAERWLTEGRSFTLRGAEIGSAIIPFAERHGLTLQKFSDPTEGHRADLSPDEARQIMREDPSLIYVSVKSAPKKPAANFSVGEIVMVVEEGPEDGLDLGTLVKIRKIEEEDPGYFTYLGREVTRSHWPKLHEQWFSEGQLASKEQLRARQDYSVNSPVAQWAGGGREPQPPGYKLGDVLIPDSGPLNYEQIKALIRYAHALVQRDQAAKALAVIDDAAKRGLTRRDIDAQMPAQTWGILVGLKNATRNEAIRAREQAATRVTMTRPVARPGNPLEASKRIADPADRLLFDRRRLLTLFWDHGRGEAPISPTLIDHQELRPALVSLISEAIAVEAPARGWGQLTPAGVLVVRALFSGD